MTFVGTPTPFEEALERTGNGLYNYLLTATCSLILLAIGMDLLGFSLIVVAACDLKLTVAQKGILTSLPYIGILLSSYFWGYISDTRGRKFTLIISSLAGFFLSSLSSLSPNWMVLAIIKFLSICFSCAANSATYTLVGESCIQRIRSQYVLAMTCLLILSPGVAAALAYPTLLLKFELYVPLLGFTYRSWRLLLIVLAFPCGVGGIIICFFHESPKFLANKGKNDEALKVLKSIYAINHASEADEFKITSVVLEDASTKKKMSIMQALFEQSAPMFRKPLLTRTLQLFFIVFVAYITNNSFLLWFPQLMDVVRITMSKNSTSATNVCSLLSNISSDDDEPEKCLGYIESNILITIFVSQSLFAFLNFILSYLMRWRRLVLISILCVSTLSGILVNLMPEPISSVFFFVMFPCTCLTMGILAGYFVDLYPTSCRGMAACLNIMVGRSSAFIGINLLGNIIFNYCEITFYLWSLLVFSSVIVAWYLPKDQKCCNN